MSITVPLDELATTLATYPWCYLVTVSDDQRAHSLAVPTVFTDGRFTAAAGRSTRANVAARPTVTLMFPPPSGHEYSLIIDGVACVEGDTVLVEATAAVLHRPALRD
jgi:hypothetical protein